MPGTHPTPDSAIIARWRAAGHGRGEGATQAAMHSCLEAMQWRVEQAEQRRQRLPPANYPWSYHTTAEETEHNAAH